MSSFVSPEETEVETLLDLGLTVGQAKVYLTLLKMGQASKAITVYKMSNVARQDVYRILTELQECGMVEKLIGRPAKFRAVKAKQAVEILLKNKSDHLTELSFKAVTFAKKMFEKENGAHLPNSEQFVVTVDKKAGQQKIEEAFKKAQKSIKLVSSADQFILDSSRYADFFSKAHSRNVEIQWIVSKPQRKEIEANLLRALLKIPKIRLRVVDDHQDMAYVIYDDKEVVLTLKVENTGVKTEYLWSNNSAFLVLAKSHFDQACLNSSDLKAKKVPRASTPKQKNNT